MTIPNSSTNAFFKFNATVRQKLSRLGYQMTSLLPINKINSVYINDRGNYCATILHARNLALSRFILEERPYSRVFLLHAVFQIQKDSSSIENKNLANLTLLVSMTLEATFAEYHD
jgi:hypothetical protein